MTEKLRVAVEKFSEAEQTAIKSAECFAECVEHPSDMAVLWMINSSMIMGTRALRQYAGNVLAFYEGREYWEEIQWDLLFQNVPFPVNNEEIKLEKFNADYEPG